MIMTGDDCDQQGVVNDWSLTKKNSCHLAVQNSEMGEMRNEMVALRNDVNEKFISFDGRMDGMQQIDVLQLWIWGIIASTLIVMAIKRLFAQKTK